MTRSDLIAHLLSGSAKHVAEHPADQRTGVAIKLVLAARTIADLVDLTTNNPTITIDELMTRVRVTTEIADSVDVSPIFVGESPDSPDVARIDLTRGFVGELHRWSIEHVHRTAKFLDENDYPSAVSRSTYKPGPGQVGRIDLACGLILSFYRTGKAVVGGSSISDRSSVCMLLLNDGWVVS